MANKQKWKCQQYFKKITKKRVCFYVKVSCLEIPNNWLLLYIATTKSNITIRQRTPNCAKSNCRLWIFTKQCTTDCAISACGQNDLNYVVFWKFDFTISCLTNLKLFLQNLVFYILEPLKILAKMLVFFN